MMINSKNPVCRLIIVICLCVQLVSLCDIICMTDKNIHTAVLSGEINNNYISRAINQKYYTARLIPSSRPDAREEERVLFALRSGNVDFLTQRELELFQFVKTFSENNMNKTTLEKIYAAVTTTCYMATYDLDADRRDTAYSALIGRRCVCSGYSRATQLLLESVGITSIYAVGDVEGGGSHAWNIVRLDDCDETGVVVDSTWIAVDCTWADNDLYLDKWHRIRPETEYLILNSELMASREWNGVYPKADGDVSKYIEEIMEEYYYA